MFKMVYTPQDDLCTLAETCWKFCFDQCVCSQKQQFMRLVFKE